MGNVKFIKFRRYNMNKCIETLLKDLDKVSKQIDSMSVNDDNYEILLEERDKIRNELLKYEISTKELEFKNKQLVDENKHKWISIGVDILKGAGKFLGTCLFVKVILDFDRENVSTNSPGKPFINGIVSKWFK